MFGVKAFLLVEYLQSLYPLCNSVLVLFCKSSAACYAVWGSIICHNAESCGAPTASPAQLVLVPLLWVRWFPLGTAAGLHPICLS